MKFGCCMGLETFIMLSPKVNSSMKNLSFKEKLERISFIMSILEENGFDYVEAEVTMLFPEEKPNYFKTFVKKMQAFSIKPEVFSAFIPPWLKVVGPKVNMLRLKNYLEKSIYRVSEAGGKVIIWGSGTSRSYPENYPTEYANKQINDFLYMAADYALKYDISLAVEPMNKEESNTINSLKEAINIEESINKKEVKIMVDFYHFTLEKEDFSSIKIAGDKVIHVHISDSERRYPGIGNFQFTPFIKSLKSINYNKRISLECNFRNFEKESKKGLKFIKKAWEQA